MSVSVLEQFSQIKVWKRDAEEAPHKPLLILYALGRWQNERQSRLSFKDVNRDLTALLERYGPARDSYHPEYPFWRLRNDGVWQVEPAAELTTRASNSDPKKIELLEKDVHAGFSAGVLAALEADAGLASRIARLMLDRYFAPTQHDALLADVGLADGTEP